MLLLQNQKAPVFANILSVQAYTGPLLRLRRSSDNTTFDVYPATLGNTVALLAWALLNTITLDAYLDQNGGAATLSTGASAQALVTALSLLLGGLVIQAL